MFDWKNVQLLRVGHTQFIIQTTMSPSHRGEGCNKFLHARGVQRPHALATWPSLLQLSPPWLGFIVVWINYGLAQISISIIGFNILIDGSSVCFGCTHSTYWFLKSFETWYQVVRKFLGNFDIDSYRAVLISLATQHGNPQQSDNTSNKSNSACWKGLHPVFPSNFTNKSFGFLEQSGWFYKYAFCHMSLWNPESLSLISPFPWEEFGNVQRRLTRPSLDPSLYTDGSLRSPWLGKVAKISNSCKID